MLFSVAMAHCWDTPLCLIENTGEGGLQINQFTLQKLTQVTVPVSVVAIVGLYRTGKSYLLNILAGKQTGKICFSVHCVKI